MSAHILGALIGGEQQRRAGPRYPIDLAYELFKALLDGISGEINLRIESLTPFLLRRSPSAGPTHQRVVESVGVLELLADQDVNVIREVLGDTEVLDPVCDQIL